MRQLIAQLTLMIGLTFGNAALAAVLATVTPDEVALRDGAAAIVTLRWRVEVTSGTAQTLVVSSPSGTLNVYGGPITDIGGPLSQRVDHPGGTITVTFTERLRIPRDMVRLMLDDDGGNYTRSFDDVTGATSPVSVELGTIGASSTALRNFALSFDDASHYRLVRRDEALTAQVSITSAGRGSLDGIWEVAGPSGRGFRPIERRRVPLSGSRNTVVESPALPTDRAGTYRVRFSIGGDRTQDYPTVTYVVTPQAGAEALGLIAPKAGAEVNAATRFEWHPVPSAARYRVEFRDRVGSVLVAAVDVRDTSAMLRAFTLARLVGEDALVWRVIAYDSSGKRMAVSPARAVGSGGSVPPP